MIQLQRNDMTVDDLKRTLDAGFKRISDELKKLEDLIKQGDK